MRYPTMRSPIRFSLALVSLLAPLGAGCGGGVHAVRGEDTPGLDAAAISTGLDRRDLQRLANENLEKLRVAPVVQRWAQMPERPSVAVLPIRNETSEHIDSALAALISDIETYLINWGALRVISHESQRALMEEIKLQSTDGFDQSKIASWGKQIGSQYFVTGKVFTTDERAGDQRRVQYYLFLQVLDVETGEILFQNKAAVTKALVN
ncbi:MAG: penicillin-binding protein activator LpoB [Polyangiales bacterium]|nr:penicillin-binding protein activator LpoB [Myxococcales bacterium]